MHKLPISVSSRFWKEKKKQYFRVYAQLKLNINQGTCCGSDLADKEAYHYHLGIKI